MIGRVNTGGGGGGLNFRVLGGTSTPSVPKENDIWVNTNVPISDWAFSSEEPYLEKRTIHCTEGTTAACLDSSGSNTYFPQSNITTYTELPEGTTKITISNSEVETADMYHAFYTADKTLISTVERKKGTTTYDVPSNAVYVRLTLFDNAPLSYDPLSFVAMVGVGHGFVWISTATDSLVAFNALKKHNITVYPNSAKQRVSGAWVDKETQVYQNGAWETVKTPITYYFDNGDVVENSGGWSCNYKYQGVTVTIGTVLKAVAGSSSGDYTFKTQLVDITDISSLTFVGYADVWKAEYPATFGVMRSVPTANTLDTTLLLAKTSVTADGNFTINVDVSSVTGSVSIVFGGYYQTVEVSSIYGE